MCIHLRADHNSIHFEVLAEEFRVGYLGDSVHCCEMNYEIK
jgi:hypothetical protein